MRKHSYQCPRCGSIDLRVNIGSTFAIEEEGTLALVSDPPQLFDIMDHSFVACSNEDCEFEGPAEVFLLNEQDTDLVTRHAPRWAWDIIDETLSMDAQAGNFDEELKTRIRAALDVMINASEGE